MENSKNDFVSHITLIQHKSRKVQSENELYVFQTKFALKSEHEPLISFYIYSKDKIYKKDFDYETFIEYKEVMGFEGNWKVFFTTMRNAIENVEDGEMKVERKEMDKVKLIIVHPIAKDVKVSSEIVLEETEGRKLKEFFFWGLIEMIEEKEELKNIMEEKKNNNNNNNDNSNIEMVIAKKENIDIMKGLEIKKHSKRKYQSNLINPNIKKRKKKGIQFIKEDSDNEFSNN